MKFMDVQAAGGTLKLAKIARGADYFGVRTPRNGRFPWWTATSSWAATSSTPPASTGARRPATRPIPTASPIVGRWLKSRGTRDRVVLITKGAHHVMEDPSQKRVNRACIDSDLETSLRELGVDSVDIYFLHRDDPEKPVSEIMDALDRHVKAGRIRALGASNWTCARIAEANAYARANGKTPFTVSQIQWGVAYVKPGAWPDPTLVSMTPEEYAGYLALGIPVMAFSPQAGGYFSKMISGEPLQPKFAERYDGPENRRRLAALREICARTGASPAAVLLGYITSNRLPGSAVIGCSTLEQLEDSMSACDLTLSEADIAALEQ